MTNKYSILCLLLFFYACNHKAETPTDTTKQPIISDSTLQLLKIDTVQISNIDDVLKLSGQVSFNDNKVVKVYPFSSGQVQSVNVSMGDYVKAGQTLATIKSADIAGNYSDLSIANNDISITKRGMENAERLYKNGISSQKEYIEAKETYLKAVSNANKINTQIKINGGGRTNATGTYTVSAPRSGYVLEKFINPGNFIRGDNSNNLFTIGDINDVWVFANVFEADIAKVKQGYRAEVTTIAYPDSVIVGKVDKVNQMLDPVTKVMQIKIVLPNNRGLLKPQMFANVLISNSSINRALCIPSSGVISENGKSYVVVYNNPNDVKVQEIMILKTVGAKTFISDGVALGQKIITQNQILVYNKLKENK